MARPYKQGLEYFPWSVRAFEDPKLSSLSYHYGPLGVMVYIRIITLVYKEGYYLEMSEEDLAVLLHQQMGPQWIKVDKVLDMIHGCVELRLFERALFLQGVITSVSIQRQFILSTKKRRNIHIDKYWLLDQKTMEELGSSLSMQKNNDIDSENAVIDSNNQINGNNNSQSKSESKRDIKINIDKSIYGFPKMHYITRIIIQRKYITEFDSDVLRYNELFEYAVASFGYENVLSGVNYLIKYSRNPGVPIDDRFGFMKSSLLNNLERFQKLDEKRGESFESWFKCRVLQVDR